MNIFNIISLLGGLAMFLYGMRLMGDGLKEGSSDTLKNVMEKATNNVVSAFFLGLSVTALIQSSTAAIVITSGLVGAGIITLRQSLGIIIGANVGTTVTGQIIRLLDLNGSASGWLQFFKPSTLAPLALIAGMICIMALKSKRAGVTGTIAVGFGILFSGLMAMTDSVSVLNESGVLEPLFANFDKSPFLGYITGASIAFLLQSSSATIGILQAFAMTGVLTFRGIYAVLVGIYLGDCVTTAIVCSIGARPDAKRVGVVHILFNLSETVLVFVFVTILHKVGVLDEIWNKTITSGGIANTNTVFNLSCAVLLMPMVRIYEVLSYKLIKGEKTEVNPYADKLEALDPKFYITPAIAFNSCYNALLAMYNSARNNIDKGFAGLMDFDAVAFEDINTEEDHIDAFADKLSNYLVNMAPYIQTEIHTQVMNQYYKLISEFERMGDHALNIAEAARDLSAAGLSFSDAAEKELKVLKQLINRILDCAYQAFVKRDITAAKQIEPLEEVVDDMINTLRENHLARLAKGECNVEVDNLFLNLLSDIERISDICSNIGISVIARIDPSISSQAHNYISKLHQGNDAEFNRIYESAHKMYFAFLTDNNK